jgi:superoxide dismutase, Cu-Zn family
MHPLIAVALAFLFLVALYLSLPRAGLFGPGLLRAQGPGLLRARAVIRGPEARGLVLFSETPGAGTHVTGRLTGLTPGVHGFHIHEKGGDPRVHHPRTRQDCEAAGPHYNPFGHTHGGPAAANRHVGDLGNVTADAHGVALYEHYDPQLTLQGPYSVLGRAVVVHERADDLGLGGQPDSLQTGHAGARVGCGVIEAF